MQAREQKIDMNSFARRHIGPNEDEVAAMLSELELESIERLIDAAVPRNIRLHRQLNLPESKSEIEALAELRATATKSRVHSSAPATTTALRRRSSSETFSKIPAGTPLIRLTKRRSRKAASRRCSISNR